MVRLFSASGVGTSSVPPLDLRRLLVQPVEDGPDVCLFAELVQVLADLAVAGFILQLLTDLILCFFERDAVIPFALDDADDVEAAIILQDRAEPIDGQGEDGVFQYFAAQAPRPVQSCCPPFQAFVPCDSCLATAAKLAPRSTWLPMSTMA